MRAPAICLCILVWTVAPGPGARASGASTQPADLTDLSLEELMQVEIPTVYAASRYEQKVTDAPSAVTIVTADAIRAITASPRTRTGRGASALSRGTP